MTKKVVQRGSNGKINVLWGCSIVVRCVQRGGPMAMMAMSEGCRTVRCVGMGFDKGNALGGILHQDVSRGGSMVMS